MVLFGVLGFIVKRYGYSPVALLLGLILGNLLEDNFYRSVMVGGPEIFFIKPIALGLMFLSVLSLALPAALRYADYGYVLENGRVVLDGEARTLADNEDVKEFYLGFSGGDRQSFRDVKHYRRRKRWLA